MLPYGCFLFMLLGFLMVLTLLNRPFNMTCSDTYPTLSGSGSWRLLLATPLLKLNIKLWDYSYLAKGKHWKDIISWVHFPVWIILGVIVEYINIGLASFVQDDIELKKGCHAERSRSFSHQVSSIVLAIKERTISLLLSQYSLLLPLLYLPKCLPQHYHKPMPPPFFYRGE